MRSIWKGSVAFGLVNVPVKVYSATEERDIRFHQVHEADGGRIRYKRVCELDGKTVEFADIAKAYEAEDGRTVILTDDDFAQLPANSSREIEVSSFVPADQIDPLLFDKSYYLEPASTSTKAYVLLCRTLEQTDRIAIVNFALRQKTRLAAAAGARRRARHPDAAVARRGAGRRVPLPRRGRHDQARRAEDGRHAGRQLCQRLPTRGLHRRVPRRARAADRGETRRWRGTFPAPEAKEEGEDAEVVDLLAALQRSVDRHKDSGGNVEGLLGFQVRFRIQWVTVERHAIRWNPVEQRPVVEFALQQHPRFPAALPTAKPPCSPQSARRPGRIGPTLSHVPERSAPSASAHARARAPQQLLDRGPG